jgi:multicomponent Na+:H+ antiporter subunit G
VNGGGGVDTDGTFFGSLGAMGLIRLPETLIRKQASTKAGTLGAGLILAAVGLMFADIGTVAESLLAMVFIFMTAPVAAHLTDRAAYRSGV